MRGRGRSRGGGLSGALRLGGGLVGAIEEGGTGEGVVPLLSSRLDGRERLMAPMGIALVARRVVVFGGVWRLVDAADAENLVGKFRDGR